MLLSRPLTGAWQMSAIRQPACVKEEAGIASRNVAKRLNTITASRSRADHVLAGGRHADGGNVPNSEAQGRARPVLRGDDLDCRGDGTGRQGRVGPRMTSAGQRAPITAERRRPTEWKACRIRAGMQCCRPAMAGPPRNTGRAVSRIDNVAATATWSAPARRSRPCQLTTKGGAGALRLHSQVDGSCCPKW